VEFVSLLQDALMDRFRATLPEESYQEMIKKLTNRTLSPGQAIESILPASPKLP
jgi:hypothetical protein